MQIARVPAVQIANISAEDFVMLLRAIPIPEIITVKEFQILCANIPVN